VNSGDGYLEYPRRRRGMDHDLYRWRTIGEAPFYRWPGGKSLAVWFCIPLEQHRPSRFVPGFRPAGAPQWQPFDYREWTWRDYGHRVGIWRLLRILQGAGIRATVPVNSDLARRFPELLGDLFEFEPELMAHGVAANVVHHDAMTPADEASLIDECLSTLASHSVRCRGWLSPGFSESLRTADLLRERGLTYVGDWVNDDTPYRFTNGLVSLPGGYDTSDLNVVWDGARSARDWSEQVMAMLGFLAEEAAAEGPRVACVMVHPWLTGQPHRVDSFRRVVDFAAGLDSCWRATGAEIAGHAQAELPTVDGAVEG